MHSREREMENGALATDAVAVRALQEGDVAAIVRIDRASTGQTRAEFYASKVRTALAEPRIRTSLVALVDGHVVGFVLARLHYGEFGRAEPVAVVDAIGVDPAFRRRHAAEALLRQLTMNLAALHVERVETQVDWTQLDLLGFLTRQGFRPAPRLCLERTL